MAASASTRAVKPAFHFHLSCDINLQVGPKAVLSNPDSMTDRANRCAEPKKQHDLEGCSGTKGCIGYQRADDRVGCTFQHHTTEIDQNICPVQGNVAHMLGCQQQRVWYTNQPSTDASS